MVETIFGFIDAAGGDGMPQLSAGGGRCERPAVLAHGQRLLPPIDASPALQRFMRQAALILQKIGPGSWVSFTEDHLYAPGDAPALRKRLLARGAIPED